MRCICMYIPLFLCVFAGACCKSASIVCCICVLRVSHVYVKSTVYCLEVLFVVFSCFVLALCMYH